MLLNTIRPGIGSKQAPKRLGRGIGSGLGKTCGRGHKGQRARAGGFHKLGFEGGQMPIQRRLPKFGFVSLKAKKSAEVRLHELAKIDAKVINLDVLLKAHLVKAGVTNVKVIAQGELKKAVHLVGIKVTKGAKAAIEAVGGKVELAKDQ